MRHYKILVTIFIGLLHIATAAAEEYTRYVNPKIGSGGHGHVFVGANVPFGMVQLGPTSIPQEWDWCSGYHDSDSTVIGFSHTHLSGTGIGDLFDITVMPATGEVTYGRGREDDPATGMWSYADRSKEVVRPGYYSVPLTRYGIKAEMTATNRVGLHRYTFPKAEDAGIVFNMMNGGCWDRPMDAHIERVDPKTGQPDPNGQALRGYRFSRGWADDQKIYFYAEFSKPFESVDILKGDIQIWENEFKNMSAFAHVHFKTRKNEQVLMKVALSPVSMEGAYRNMKAEMPGWDFDKTAKAADKAWDQELGRIKIESKDAQALKIFYTALYHTMIAPSTFYDADSGNKTYTTFSLWDTYRAAMPLYSIFQAERNIDFINTMLAIHEQQGKLPVWHLHGCETNCMVGNPGIIPVADAIAKGIPGIDYEKAFEAIKVSALRPDRGQEHRMKHGYIPCDLMDESVAYDLEYALADGAAANAAKVLGKKKDYQYFNNRSKSYRKLFDPELGFIRGKDSKGNFREEYSPFASTHRADDYCEGNGWQYTWLVPHDVEGLVECFGGRETFIDKLDSLFLVSSVIEGAESSPDISGLIGQYAHGNEPSHHILYLYTMVGQPWKAADRIREVLSTLYSDKKDGLSGNEDVGQMSAWYIMSAMGFYQVEPASARYWFGTPLFDKVEINVPGGKFTITALENSAENRYIQSVTLNGKDYTKGYIEHKDIMAGGELIFAMGAEPKVWYCNETPDTQTVRNPVDYVSTLVGTLSHHAYSTGNTYPAVAMPWGMNFWTPQGGRMGDGWAYRYDQNWIRGFKQTHQPSPWINDYGQFAIMPVRDASWVDENDRASYFSHKSETAKPYYYQVYLADHDINVELSPTERAAVFEFTYPDSETSGVVIDAFDSGSYIKVLPEQNAIIGYTTKNSGGVPENFRNWFVLQFDKDFESWKLYDGPSNPVEGVSELDGDRILASVGFKTVRGEKVGVKAASSFISLEQAWRNFQEVEGRTLTQVKEAARDRWNEVLGRIEVGGGSQEQYRTFYSCLYRATLFPRKFYEIDADGKPIHYSPYNGQVCDGYLYTDTGFWDTFRALFPLLNLVYPSVNEEIQQGLANIARENEFLPEWASPGHRGCMVGNNSASVVADAILKGITPEKDWQTLYDCIVYGTEHVHPEVSSTGRLGHEYYNSIGYIPYNVGINENVARTLEYAYNDWCILQLARKLGRPQEELDKWEARSGNWKNVFDPSHNLMRGRNLDGSFQEPFSPYKWGGAFTEGNAWHYTWSVFHDVDGLAEAMGGKDVFAQRLDSVFVVPPIYDDSYYGYRIHEITEMQVANMGNYAHGNQPAQHMIYLYNWAGQPEKTQKWVREVMDRLYSSAPDGYCGDEDNGQTSAWYVFSALGFYPVCPGSGEYAVGTPLFERAVVHLENGKRLEINAEGLGPYIKDIKVDGGTHTSWFFDHDTLKDGTEIDFTFAL